VSVPHPTPPTQPRPSPNPESLEPGSGPHLALSLLRTLDAALVPLSQLPPGHSSLPTKVQAACVGRRPDALPDGQAVLSVAAASVPLLVQANVRVLGVLHAQLSRAVDGAGASSAQAAAAVMLLRILCAQVYFPPSRQPTLLCASWSPGPTPTIVLIIPCTLTPPQIRELLGTNGISALAALVDSSKNNALRDAAAAVSARPRICPFV
jgi:hypothetical protein